MPFSGISSIRDARQLVCGCRGVSILFRDGFAWFVLTLSDGFDCSAARCRVIDAPTSFGHIETASLLIRIRTAMLFQSKNTRDGCAGVQRGERGCHDEKRGF
jgi:hypothetical protein